MYEIEVHESVFDMAEYNRMVEETKEEVQQIGERQRRAAQIELEKYVPFLLDLLNVFEAVVANVARSWYRENELLKRWNEEKKAEGVVSRGSASSASEVFGKRSNLRSMMGMRQRTNRSQLQIRATSPSKPE